MARGSTPSRRWVLGILLISVSLLTALSLPGLGLARDVGPFGRVWVRFWAGAFGRPAVWALTALGVLWASALLIPWRRPFLWGATLLLGPLLVLWDAFTLSWMPLQPEDWRHGAAGAFTLRSVRAFFGGAAAQTSVALGGLALVAATCFFRWGLPAPLGDRIAAGLSATCRFLARVALSVARGAGHLLAKAGTACLARFAAWRAQREEERERARSAREARGAGGGAQHAPRGRLRAALDELPGRKKRQTESDEMDAGSEAEFVHSEPGAAFLERQEGTLRAAAAGASGEARESARGPGLDREPAARRSARSREGAATKARVEVPEPLDGPAVALLELLDERDDQGSGADRDEIERTAALIAQTLASFGISGEVGEVHPGPVITRYEFCPGAGVTVSQISSRQDDLALALRTPRVRLLAPIPGKAAVGIEIPNRVPALISFREIASRREFREAREPLCVALGKDVAGRPFYASLEKMPHLLVAGTTGSGKSVCINSLIVSLLLRCPPQKLRLLLIDPKMLELTTYNEIPHLLRPVVTEAREAARALQWLTREMERRYRLLAGLGARNIEAYLERRAEGRDDPPLGGMPYIVVFVDELADLMLSSPAEIEVPIARLAQMARAVGIHLVLATQRPSVDVITGVIKANFPARIAFQVATRTDSRTILDSNGAESLVGRGDMLFIPPGKAQAHRIHGAFLSDAETERTATYLRQFPPAEDLTASPASGETAEEAGGEFEDPLFHEAMRIVVTTRQGSTSMLQRRLRVGYTRAGRLMDLLERAGVVGPPDGSRAREVLVSPEYFEEAARERVRSG